MEQMYIPLTKVKSLNDLHNRIKTMALTRVHLEEPVVVELREPYFTLILNHIKASKALNVWTDDVREWSFAVGEVPARIKVKGQRMTTGMQVRFRYKGMNML